LEIICSHFERLVKSINHCFIIVCMILDGIHGPSSGKPDLLNIFKQLLLNL
jgi:hypothetical protein